MSRKTTQLIKAALSALHYSGADRLMAPMTAGSGIIFMLHQVRPDVPAAFSPNRILSITPEFLDATIRLVLERGFDIVSMDDVPERLSHPTGRPFACFTLDDGYRDNRDHALPVFRRHRAPLTIYVPSAFADGEGDLWWLNLEHALARVGEARIEIKGVERVFRLRNPVERTRAFHDLYWHLRSIPETATRAWVAGLCHAAGFDPGSTSRELLLTWDELRELAKDPLITIGAHTCNHFALAKLGRKEALEEMRGSIERIERELGRPCRHFSYPYGDQLSTGEREFELARELGVATAVTTRKGLLQSHHKDRLTALPRLSLNGDYQDERYVKVLMSGLPFSIRDAVRKAVHAAP